MKWTMVMAMTVDGIVARGDEKPPAWTSAEDKTHFHGKMMDADAIISGRKSFEGRLVPRDFYVLTRNRELIESSEAPVFYTDALPRELAALLEERGYQHPLLLGGPEINQMFWDARLVDELYLTVEPKLFGSGKHLASGKAMEQELVLESAKQLNSRGTLLLHYLVKKD